MNRAISSLLSITRGLLIMGVLLTLFIGQAYALELKVNITPPSAKEYTIEVTDSTNIAQKKLTIGHEAIFEVTEGFVTILIEGKKKIRKYIAKPSILQVLFND